MTEWWLARKEFWIHLLTFHGSWCQLCGGYTENIRSERREAAAVNTNMASCNNTGAPGRRGVPAQIMAKFNHCRKRRRNQDWVNIRRLFILTGSTSDHQQGTRSASDRQRRTWKPGPIQHDEVCVVGSHLVEVELNGAAVLSVELLEDPWGWRWVTAR